MIELFEKYVDWKILAHFLKNPTGSFYVKELARLLDVSPASVSSALNRFREWGLVTKEKKAQSHLYRLNNELPVVKELKNTYFLIRLQDLGFVQDLLEVDEGIISIVLYGSFATGDYDEKSDIDLLVISAAKADFSEFLKEVEDRINNEVNLEVFSPGQWTKMKDRDDPFRINVIRDHILLWGSELI